MNPRSTCILDWSFPVENQLLERNTNWDLVLPFPRLPVPIGVSSAERCDWGGSLLHHAGSVNHACCGVLPALVPRASTVILPAANGIFSAFICRYTEDFNSASLVTNAATASKWRLYYFRTRSSVIEYWIWRPLRTVDIFSSSLITWPAGCNGFSRDPTRSMYCVTNPSSYMKTR